MSPGDVYARGKLVRVRCDGDHPFTAGIIIHPETRRACFAADILKHYLGQHEDQLRASFRRLGWRATVVRDFAPEATYAR